MIDTLVVLGIIIVVAVWLTIAIVRTKHYGVESFTSCVDNCQTCKAACHDSERKRLAGSIKDEKRVEEEKSASCCH